jgi:hypothetical protein
MDNKILPSMKYGDRHLTLAVPGKVALLISFSPQEMPVFYPRPNLQGY